MGKKQNNNEKIIAIVLVIAVLILGIYKLFFEKNDVVEEKIDTETISVVNDASRFFTVTSCVSKYINYLSIKDTDNLLTLLSNQYQEENQINSNNIYNYLGIIDGTNTFTGKKILVQRVTKSIYKYYVHGFIQEEIMDSVTPKQDFYVIIILDEENMTFSVEPYNGDLFK